MATKPSLVPVWNTGGANNVAPSAGEKVSGWTASQIPPSSYFNWLQKLAGEWFQYLSDGNLTGAFTFNSTVGVSGLLTASAGVSTTTIAASGVITASSTIVAAGLITANGGVTGGTGDHITVVGTGRFLHGSMSKLTPGCGAVATGSITFSTVSWNGGPGAVTFPIVLPQGAVLDSFKVWVDNQNRAPGHANEMTVALVRTSGTTQVGTDIEGPTSPPAAVGVQEFTVTCPGYSIEAKRQYQIRIDFGDTAQKAWAAEVFYRQTS